MKPGHPGKNPGVMESIPARHSHTDHTEVLRGRESQTVGQPAAYLGAASDRRQTATHDPFGRVGFLSGNHVTSPPLSILEKSRTSKTCPPNAHDKLGRREPSY